MMDLSRVHFGIIHHRFQRYQSFPRPKLEGSVSMETSSRVKYLSEELIQEEDRAAWYLMGGL